MVALAEHNVADKADIHMGMPAVPSNRTRVVMVARDQGIVALR